MRIINQTDRVIRKADGKVPKKQQIPGLNKIRKPKVSVKPLPYKPNTNNSRPPAPQQPPKQNEPQPSHNTSTTDNYQSEYGLPSGLHAEITAFMKPLGPLMDWDLDSFDLEDAMALDTQWLEGLDFLPTEKSTKRRSEDETHTPPSAQEHKAELEAAGIHNEFRLVSHYSTHMTRFYSVKDPAWNFYTAMNEEFAYRYAPLRHALLAWSSLHLSIMEGTEDNLETAQKHYQIALKGLMGEDFGSSKIPLEILLVGSYYLCLFDIMAGQNQLKSILRHVWGSLKLGSLLEASSLYKLTAVSYQIITWLIYLDVRSALFEGNIQFPNYFEVGPRRTRPNTPSVDADKDDDVQYLLRSELYEKSVVSNIFARSQTVLKTSFGARYPQSSEKMDVSLDRNLVVMVKNMLMFASLVRLRNWLSECGNSLEFHPHTLQLKIEELRKETEAYCEAADNHPVSQFHVLIELALINAVTIYFERICNPDVRTSAESQGAAGKIVEIAKLLKGLRVQGTPGSLQWPFPLVIAGIETTDPVLQMWVLQELEDNEKEGWGIGLKKARGVIREVIRRQNEQGRRVDLGEVMVELNEVVII